MAFLSGLFEKKSESGAVSRALGGSVSMSWGGGLGPIGNWDYDQAITKGYERVIWVWRCVDVIAQNQSTISIELKKGLNRQNAELVDDPRLWKLLNHRTNIYETAFQFRYRLSTQLLLSKRGAFIEIVKGRDNRPTHLHLLPVGQTRPVPDSKKFVSHYEVTDADHDVKRVEAEDVIWIRLKPHPSDPYQQMTPLQAAGIEADTDWLARIFNRNFLNNDGRPGMLVTIDGGPTGLSPEDAEIIKRRFSGGPTLAGQTTVIEGTGLNVQDMSANPRDTQWSELLASSKERIMLAFGVPESVMGNASGRTFDNADAERENFWIDTMRTHCDPIASALDILTGDSNDDTMFAYKYEEVDVLQRMADRRREEWRGEVTSGLRTIDDYMEAIGKEPFGTIESRVLYLPNGVVVARPQDREAAMKIRQTIIPPEPSGAGDEVPKAIAQSNAQLMRSFGNQIAARIKGIDVEDAQPIELKQVHICNYCSKAGNHKISDLPSGLKPFWVCDDHLKRGKKLTQPPALDPPKPGDAADPTRAAAEKGHPYLARRENIEGLVEGIVLGWDARQGDVVGERLAHVKSRKGTRHWDDEVKGFPKNQKCKYCSNPVTKRVIWAEGAAYIPVCNEHVERAKDKVGSDLNEVREAKELKTLDPNYAVEIDRWANDLTEAVEAVLRREVRRELRAASADMEANGITMGKRLVSGMYDSRAEMDRDVDRVVKSVLGVVQSAARNQSARIAAKIAELEANGTNLADISDAIRKMTSSRSQWRKTLANNVTTGATELARWMIYSKGGQQVEKTWRTYGDERVRKSHEGANGQTRYVSDHFHVGHSYMQVPGDPSAPLSETVNCRCWVEYTLRKKESGR